MTINNIITEEVSLYLNEQAILNEAFDFNKIKTFVSSITNKQQYLKQLVDKLGKETQDTVRYKLGGIIVGILMFWNPSIQNPDAAIKKIIQTPNITTEKVIEIAKEEAPEAPVKEVSKHKFVDPQTLTLSEEGKNLIKKHEGLRLKAYKIGDGKITIGYGHAEPISKSRYKVGQKISQEEADKLFDRDVKAKIDGVKRMFRQWKARGNDVKITQGMFDALVSIAYNTGVTGLRNTEFADKLEVVDNPLNVADMIKSTRLKKGFTGLVKRRNDEYKRFIEPS